MECLRDVLVVEICVCVLGFSGGSAIKNAPVNAVWSLGWEDPWRKKWQPTPIFLPGKSYGQRSLVGYSPWGHKELDMTEWLTFSLLFFSLLDGSRKKQVSLAACFTVRQTGPSLTCSHFHLLEKLWTKKFSLDPGLCHLEGRLTQVQWNWSSYLLQCTQSWSFSFVPAVCWDFSDDS